MKLIKLWTRPIEFVPILDLFSKPGPKNITGSLPKSVQEYSIKSINNSTRVPEFTKKTSTEWSMPLSTFHQPTTLKNLRPTILSKMKENQKNKSKSYPLIKDNDKRKANPLQTQVF